MKLLQDFLDRSKQLNQTSTLTSYPAYHGPNKTYKIIHQALILPNLPAPLHYLNFISRIGQPNIPMLANPSAIHTTALDTATVLVSSSLHQVGQLKTYSIQHECQFDHKSFKFLDQIQLRGQFPDFRLFCHDAELSIDLKIKTTSLISHFTKLHFSMAQHWSLLCHCEGTLQHQHEKYHIKGMGSFEYARSLYFPYVPWAFFTYQIINLEHDRQILLRQIRDRFNRVIQSRIYLRDIAQQRQIFLDQNVFFKIHRVYPCIVTPNGQRIYLPREFEWCCEAADGTRIWLQAQSRGDFKFGLAAGYVGSFKYTIQINDQTEMGDAGYIEYSDCRDLIYQEQDKNQKLQNNLANPIPFMLKK
jgi:hypothetical protein